MWNSQTGMAHAPQPRWRGTSQGKRLPQHAVDWRNNFLHLLTLIHMDTYSHYPHKALLSNLQTFGQTIPARLMNRNTTNTLGSQAGTTTSSNIQKRTVSRQRRQCKQRQGRAWKRSKKLACASNGMILLEPWISNAEWLHKRNTVEGMKEEFKDQITPHVKPSNSFETKVMTWDTYKSCGGRCSSQQCADMVGAWWKSAGWTVGQPSCTDFDICN